MNEQKVMAALGASEKVLHRVVCSRSGALAQQAREALEVVKAAQQDLAGMRELPTAQMALVMLVRVHLQRGLSVDQVRALLVCELRGKYGWTKGQANSRVSRAINLAGVVSKMDEQTRQVKDAAGKLRARGVKLGDPGCTAEIEKQALESGVSADALADELAEEG